VLSLISESAIKKAEQQNLIYNVLLINTMAAGLLFILGIEVTITGIRPEIAQTSGSAGHRLQQSCHIRTPEARF